MKWIALLKAFDKKLCGEWHSGSCTYYKSKAGLDSKEEAEAWLHEVQHDYYKNDTERYQFTPCVLSYDENQSENVEQFFKYM